MSTAPKTRPKYYDLSLAHLPAPGLLSIFHRISGVAMVLFLIPLSLWLLQKSLASEAGYQEVKALLSHPFVKLVCLGFVWSFLHHALSGIRFLLLDVHVGIAKPQAQSSARAVIVAALVLTAIVGVVAW